MYRNNESYDTASFYFNRSLEKSIEINDSSWMARNYNSIGILYERTNETHLALDAYEKSLEIKRALFYYDGVVTTLTNMGHIIMQQRLPADNNIAPSGLQLLRRSNLRVTNVRDSHMKAMAHEGQYIITPGSTGVGACKA